MNSNSRTLTTLMKSTKDSDGNSSPATKRARTNANREPLVQNGTVSAKDEEAPVSISDDDVLGDDSAILTACAIQDGSKVSDCACSYV